MNIPTYAALTWDHPRGYRALDAAAAEMASTQGISISWDRQPLEGFESHPIGELCAKYDLVVLDHPHIGEALATNCLQPLESVFDAAELSRLRADSIGASLTSYHYAGLNWAMPLDAAAQVMAYRADLIDGTPPTRWADVEALALQGGLALSTAGPHAILSYLSMAAAFDELPAEQDPRVLVDEENGAGIISLLQRLYSQSNPDVRAENPIAILDRMASTDDIVLCPLIFGYVNYANPSSKAHKVSFSNAPRQGRATPPGSTLGGTGIGISKRCTVTAELKKHLLWLLSPEVQGRFIPQNAGQPSNRAAWLDAAVNAEWGNFYADTLATLEVAYVRPRYDGYIAWQTAASAYLRQALEAQLDPLVVAQQLNQMHAQAIGDKKK